VLILINWDFAYNNYFSFNILGFFNKYKLPLLIHVETLAMIAIGKMYGPAGLPSSALLGIPQIGLYLGMSACARLHRSEHVTTATMKNP